MKRESEKKEKNVTTIFYQMKVNDEKKKTKFHRNRESFGFILKTHYYTYYSE